MELRASKFWVVGVASLSVIEGEGEGLVVFVAVRVGVTGRKDTGGH